MSDDLEHKLQHCRERFQECSQELERVSAELQRLRQDLISRTKEVQLERETKAKQLQDLRADLKEAQINQKESRDFMEGRTRELQETIKQLVESEKQLAEARQTLDKAADQERQRISDGLHRGPVHKLSEAMLDLDLFIENIQDNLEPTQLHKIRADLEEALQMTDQAVHQLKPVELKRGLIDGLKSLLFRIFPNRQVAKFTAAKQAVDFGLDEASQIILYRFAHEALNNVQRHGKDSVRIEVSIEEINDYLNLSISNSLPENKSATTTSEESRNGNSIRMDEGHGLHNMEAYAVLLGGSMDKRLEPSRFEVRLRKRLR